MSKDRAGSFFDWSSEDEEDEEDERGMIEIRVSSLFPLPLTRISRERDLWEEREREREILEWGFCQRD